MASMERVVVVGTSQGGILALTNFVRGLTPDFPAPILIVLHIGTSESVLPSILGGIDGLTASFAQEGERIVRGHLYVAPPDRHMVLRDGHIALSRGPRENWARPAIDPLFRSAAAAFGPQAIGIVLSGRLNDGTAGLYEIKQAGGIAIVQTPSEAEAPDMPTSALENVAVDYCLPVREIPRLLTRLLREPPREITQPAAESPAPAVAAVTEPSAQTCPECGGAMREEKIGTLTSFRCHIGHVMTAEVLAAMQLETLKDTVSSVLRLLNERAGLCREIAEKRYAAGNSRAAQAWERAANQAALREETADQLLEADWIHPEENEKLELTPEEAAE